MPVSGRSLRFNFEWRTTVFTLLMLPLLVGLGCWQLQRAGEKALLAATWDERQEQPPASLGQLWEEPAENLAYRRVSLSGTFLEDKYFLLDNRIFGGRFGYEVLAIMELDGGAGLALVNRGWIVADPARRELPVVPVVPGTVKLNGHVYLAPGAPYLLTQQEQGSDWPKMLQAVEMDKILLVIEAINGKRVFPYSVRVAAGEPGALAVDWQVVNVSPDKHRAYAAQWFTMALVLLVLFLQRSSNLWQLVKSSRRNQG